MKFSIKDFFSKCGQIHRKLRIWSHSLNKSLMENFIFCAVSVQICYRKKEKEKNNDKCKAFFALHANAKNQMLSLFNNCNLAFEILNIRQFLNLFFIDSNN